MNLTECTERLVQGQIARMRLLSNDILEAGVQILRVRINYLDRQLKQVRIQVDCLLIEKFVCEIEFKIAKQILAERGIKVE